ncbi:MAG TPA: hypothetical protein VFQ24_04920 [Terriglobia bacterium]|nr:hypothetical protein [Terriglobia bacterium]
MRKAKPIVLLGAFLFATMGGCFGPLMAGHASMNCCTSMPCAPASQLQTCCTTGVPGPANQLQQAAEVTAPAVAYAVVATLPHSSAIPGAIRAANVQYDVHCYSPPGELYTIHHSLLI